MLEAGVERLGDAFEIRGEKAGPELPRGLAFGPRLSALFIGAEEQTVAFLSHIDLATEVDGVHELFAFALVVRDDLGDLLGQEVHVLHRKERQLESDHAADLTSPETAGIHHVLAVHDRFVLIRGRVEHGEIPAAVSGPIDVAHPGVAMGLGSSPSGAFEVGVGDLARVEVALVGVPHRTHEVLRIEDRQELLGLLGGDQLGLHPEVAAARMGHAEPVHALGGVGQHHTTGDVDTAVLTRHLLDLLVQLDRVLLQLGDVGIAVEGVHPTGGVPGRPGGQLGAFHEHHVGPAGLGEVVEHGGADDATADDDDLGVCFHDVAFTRLSRASSLDGRRCRVGTGAKAGRLGAVIARGTVKPASESLVMQSASMLWNRCSGSSKRGASGPG